ncbi:MAG: NINE protein [bacterium]|nr:NINE protein [bacterium]
MRSVGVAYILWALVGVLGVHRFYCGRIGTGILWFFTGGLVGIGWLVDVFLIPDLVREANLNEPPLFGPQYGQYGHYGAGPQFAVPPTPAQVAPAPMAAGTALAQRVIYCTQCGSPMKVPATASGRQYACPACRTVLEVPA